MNRRLAASAFALALVMTAACGKNLNPFEKPPGEALRSFFTTCNEGRYSEAETFLSEGIRAALKSPQAVGAGGMKGMCDLVSHNGTLTNVEIMKEEIRGEGAVVIANISFKDGPSIQGFRTDLMKEGGSWRVVFTPPAAQASSAAATPSWFAPARRVIEANPDLEIVGTNESAGTVTIRNKKTNETVTVGVADIASGKFKVAR